MTNILFIHILPKKAELILKAKNDTVKREINSNRNFSEELLPAINQMLKKVKLEDLPTFKVKCDKKASVISCNVAKATVKGLEQ